MHTIDFHGFVLTLGALIWTIGIHSKQIKAYVAPPVVITLVGIGLGWVIPQPQEFLLDYLETLSWMAVGFGVASIALRFRGQDVQHILKPGAIVTMSAMLGMCALSTLIIWWLLGVPFLLALLIGAIVTPTDPVIASSIVTGPFAEKHIPQRIRHMLSFESGSNDGLGFMFVFLAILLIQKGASGWSAWLSNTLLWQIVAAGLLGALVGWIAGKNYTAALQRHVLEEPKQVLLAGMALTVMLLAGMKLISVDSIWAAFIAVLVFASLLSGDQRKAADAYQESGVYLTMVPTLLVFGMSIPWTRWGKEGLLNLAAVVAVLLFRRLPVIAALYPFMKSRSLAEREGGESYPFRRPRDWLFYGWFGPIGLSAMYYATTAHRQLQNEQIWEISSMFILASIITHGSSAALFTRWYSKS